MSIANNVAKIRHDIEQAALACGRDPKEILLCAATKMNDADAVRQAIAAGVDCCGENRVQELTQKLSENAYEGAPVHFIGHLQTNKVRQVVGKVDLIQSVDRMKLLQCIDAEAAKAGICQDILLEINVGEEESKSGFALGDIPNCWKVLVISPMFECAVLWRSPQFAKKVALTTNFFKKFATLLLT